MVGADSQFLYAVNGVTIRLSGRMTDVQKRRRAEVERRYRADPDGVQSSFSEILDCVAHLVATAEPVRHVLCTVEHRARRRAVDGHGAFPMLWAAGRTCHESVSSRAPRTGDNPLFAGNYTDRKSRKDVAEHVRESTRFSRSVHGTLDRLHTCMLIHNIATRCRINRPKRECYRTHAGAAGIASQTMASVLDWVFHRRAVRSRQPLWHLLLGQWLRMHITPLEGGQAYLPQFMRV